MDGSRIRKEKVAKIFGYVLLALGGPGNETVGHATMCNMLDLGAPGEFGAKFEINLSLYFPNF